MPAECGESTHRGPLAGVWRHVLSGSEGAWFPRALPVWIKDDRSGGRSGQRGRRLCARGRLTPRYFVVSPRLPDRPLGLVLDRYENCPSALMWHVRPPMPLVGASFSGRGEGRSDLIAYSSHPTSFFLPPGAP
uniref:Uncharacterized protein n=1 Tax=Plectus sambesii TaxID=2011161 RepID=A0A914WPL7_9BILA